MHARTADILVHVAGLLAAAIGAPLLLLACLPEGGRAAALGLPLYVGGLVAMLTCSLLYNGLRRPRLKAILRRCDRAAIFAMIAGTYSPLVLCVIGGGWGLGLFCFVWTAAVVGMTLVLAFPRRTERLALALYLGLGWCILAALPALIEAVGWTVLALLLAGGLVYTGGVAFHLSRRLRYADALWHGCVVAAAACHYAAIFTALAPAAA